MKYYDAKSRQLVRPKSVDASDRLTKKLMEAERRANQETAMHLNEMNERVKAAERVAEQAEATERAEARRQRMRQHSQRWSDDE